MLLAFCKDRELESTYILEYFVKISVRKIPSSAIAGSERVYALKILINIAQGVSKRGFTNLIYFESFTLVPKEGPGADAAGSIRICPGFGENFILVREAQWQQRHAVICMLKMQSVH